MKHFKRTASELKVKRIQDNTTTAPTNPTNNDTVRYGIGIDMTSGNADEAADRALSSVARKLDKTLSVEYTVNQLIAEATDPLNLATIYHGTFFDSAHCRDL
jgi:ataxia telangiectasia mutated family protein